MPGIPHLPPPPDPNMFDKNKYKNHPLLTYRYGEEVLRLKYPYLEDLDFSMI